MSNFTQKNPFEVIGLKYGKTRVRDHTIRLYIFSFDGFLHSSELFLRKVKNGPARIYYINAHFQILKSCFSGHAKLTLLANNWRAD